MTLLERLGGWWSGGAPETEVSLTLLTAGREFQVSTRLYEFAELPRGERALVLPAPSPFLCGRLSPDEAAEPFVARLEASGDGAAPAFRRLLNCPAAEVPYWFSRLVTNAGLRDALTPWLVKQGEALRAFEPELHVSDAIEAGVLSLALFSEPMFGWVRALHIQTNARCGLACVSTSCASSSTCRARGSRCGTARP